MSYISIKEFYSIHINRSVKDIINQYGLSRRDAKTYYLGGINVLKYIIEKDLLKKGITEEEFYTMMNIQLFHVSYREETVVNIYIKSLK